MKKGMLKSFGNGANIDLLQDPWVKDQLPRPPVLKDNINPANISLDLLKQRDSDQWNIPMLKWAFSDKETTLICSIKPGLTTPKSDYSWIHNADDNYTVKSG